MDLCARYGYNADTNVLEWVQYPEDTTATRTNYTYDNMYRVASAAATTDAGSALSVAYTYEDDLLKSITTPTTTYNFTYGNFALRTEVKVGTRTLASYEYTSRTNYLSTLDYGNDGKVQYTYDKQGRVTQQTYEDGDTVTYKYDNSGALATVTDSATGRTTTYYYDFTDRLMKYVESGTNYSHSVGYEYDDINNLTKLVETINGIEHTTSYAYDLDNRVTSVTNGNSSVSYWYDNYSRLTSKTFKYDAEEVYTTTLTYRDVTIDGTAQTTGQVESYNVDAPGLDVTYIYGYDKNGNIVSIAEEFSGLTTSYIYDTAGQLQRENNQAANKTWVWTYDNAGNILTRTEYAYSVDTLGEAVDTVTYGYTDDNWGDLLTSYDGQNITYDTIGNPLNDGTWTYTWEHGRQLASMTDGTTTWSYEYNADGLRTSRSNGTTTYSYVYNGSTLVQMTVGDDTLYFGTGTVTYNGVVYYYVTNLQGDVIAILNSSGTAVVEYTYDAWGNILTTTGSMADTLGTVNPLTYRGYVYDHEVGYYYLQSRYYNPEVGRFINADAFASTGQGILGNNMFAYCGNNPVNMVDPSGCVYIPIIKLYEAWYKKLEEIIQENFEHNSKMDSDPETTTHNKIINDQNGATGKNFEYGNYLAEWNGCEAIAIHNARVALGMKSSLSKIMLKCQMNMGMIGDGFFGTNPLAIGDILSDCGMEYSRVGLSEMTQEGVYIISYWNPGMPFNGLHTVAVLYDGETYTTYNRGTGQSTVPPSSYATQFICGYYLGGKA